MNIVGHLAFILCVSTTLVSAHYLVARVAYAIQAHRTRMATAYKQPRKWAPPYFYIGRFEHEEAMAEKLPTIEKQIETALKEAVGKFKSAADERTNRQFFSRYESRGNPTKEYALFAEGERLVRGLYTPLAAAYYGHANVPLKPTPANDYNHSFDLEELELACLRDGGLRC